MKRKEIKIEKCQTCILREYQRWCGYYNLEIDMSEGLKPTFCKATKIIVCEEK